jgi:hypothetical protein
MTKKQFYSLIEQIIEAPSGTTKRDESPGNPPNWDFSVSGGVSGLL